MQIFLKIIYISGEYFNKQIIHLDKISAIYQKQLDVHTAKEILANNISLEPLRNNNIIVVYRVIKTDSKYELIGLRSREVIFATCHHNLPSCDFIFIISIIYL